MMEPARKQLAELAKAIAATSPDELDCDAALDLLAEYAEAIQADRSLREELDDVRRHLAQCPNCVEELDALIALCDAGLA